MEPVSTDSLEEGAIWYEFLDDIDDKVCYADTTSMVLRIDERLMMVEFAHDNITAFAFDDVVMNFRGKLGIRYLSVVADLLNSGYLKMEDVNFFYRRLVTGKDIFFPELKRLYTGRSHVVSQADIDTSDYSIVYSSNIGRYHVDYDSDLLDNSRRVSLWRHVLDFSTLKGNMAYLPDRMMLFLNGKYVNRDMITEITPGKIQVDEFDEVIECVDVFYSHRDMIISQIKRIATGYWAMPGDYKHSIIQRPERDYGHMEYMHVCEQTKRGFYDVLMDEYIWNGRLIHTLGYIAEHPEEKEAFVKDLIRKFHMIADTDLAGMEENLSRIVIPAFGDESALYQIAY